MKQLVLSDIHENLGGKMVEFAGYNMPVQYNGVKAEHHTVRNEVGVFDVSHMGEVFVSGEKSLDFLQYITTNDVSKLNPGKIQYTCFPNADGGIVDDFLLYMIADKNYLLVVNASNIEKDLAWINEHNTFGCKINNQSNNYSLLSIQGPKSIALLQELTDINLSDIKYYNFKIGSVAGINEVILSRTGYTGEIGFELYVKNESVKKLWNAMFNTSIELKPIGLAARDTLRLEKGFCLYGNDINDTTSPIEAGLGWITKFTKEFINHEELKIQKERGVIRKLVGLELIDKGIARKDYPIVDTQGNEIGVVTSGTMSPSLNKAIAMAYLSKELSKTGSEIYIMVRKKQIKAVVVSLPFLK
ncbi:MAG: glycine cleavage system aminomethyltransferase GcvT [Flavobacteriales bacterium]|nr:glycine cleavage system aminomethyltransferase GcvT [Flavobacteriales bacterium]MBT5089598.1 glycine cleavage system aminomethyltransferase GcvT [Flavobacteriales bacterium]MBT5751005.1 glycine cleavage system aminomethyltransferase GcvT [Flavobacteriales bacterium]